MTGRVRGIGGNPYIPGIGYVWKSADPTCPAELYAGTTWVQIKDRAILASGDTYAPGATGGSATHTLTVDEMPAHTHSGTTSSNGAHTHSVDVMEISGSDGFIWKLSNYKYNNIDVTSSSNGAHTHTVAVGSTGEGKSFDVMMPYIVRYMWERIG